MNFKIKALLIISLSILTIMKSNADTYIDQKYALQFDIGQLVLSQSDSTPAITRFVVGDKPFHKTVQYKLLHANLALSEFINNEQKNDTEKSNKNQITYTQIDLADFNAYEINIANKMLDIYWFVFQKKTDKRILSFFIMADQKFSTINEVTLSSYHSMKNSLIDLRGAQR